MTNVDDGTKPVQMELLKSMQTETFASSQCVILCGQFVGMSDDDWTKLTTFLAQALDNQQFRPTDRGVKESEIKFIVITSEENRGSFDVIKDDIRKETSYPIIVGTCTKNDWKAAWQSAHALVLLLQEKDLMDLCKMIPKQIRG